MKHTKIWQMITALILVIGLVMTAQPMIPAHAAPALAVSPINTWAQQYAGTAYPAGAVNPTYTIPSGDNRMLVVAISSTRTAVGTQTINVSYGGQALSLAAGDGTSAATWNHSYLYYLKEAGIQAASGTSLNVTITGGTSYYNWVYAAVFSGVDQSTPAAGAARNYNSATANNAVGPFNPTLTIATNDQAVEIINLARSAAGTRVRSITTWAAGWGTAGIDQTYNPGGTTITAHLYIRNRNILTAANDGSHHTASSTNTWDSMSALSMKAALSQAVLTVTGPASVTFGTTGTITTSGGSGSGAVSYSAGSSTGCTVGSSTGVITVTDASGTCTITAAKAADGTYNSTASAPFTVTLNRAEQAALTVTGPASLTYGASATIAFSGGSGTGALSYSAGASSGCAVNTSTGEVSVNDASGTCAVTVSRAGDNNFNSATSAPFTVTLNRAEQAALTVTGPASLTYGTTGTLTSTGGSGTGALTYSTGTSTGCSITAGTTLNVINASLPCEITVTRAADNNYNAATSIPFTVTLAKVTPTIAVVNSPVTYNGAPQAAVVGGSVPGAASNLQYDGSDITPTDAATYSVTADFMPVDFDNYNSLTAAPAGNFVIDPRLITVKADPKMKTAGSADPALTYQVTSGILAAGDHFSGALSREPGEAIGTYAILQDTLTLSANYLLTYEGDTLTIIAPLALTNLDLLQAVNETGPFSMVEGSFTGGFNMILDPAVPGGYYYLDAANLATNRPLADGLYPFTLTAHPTAGFYEFWAGRGVVEGASGWQGVMWEIINGNQPIFYLRVTGMDSMLVDGLQYLTGQGEQPLRVDGLYLLGDYSFNGLVADAYGFTAPVTVNMSFLAPLALTNLDLLQATAGSGPFTTVPGSYAGGYTMVLNPAVPGGYYYLDAANLATNRPLADGLYPFTLTAHPTAGFYEFWAGRGVVEGASGWQGVMWEIINGNQPIFYLRVTGTDSMLVDGLQYLTGQGEQPLRVDGLYLLGDYSFSGLVADAYGFTTDVSVGITFVAPTNLTVSGITANNKEYDGNDSAVLVASGAVLNGVHSGDAVNLNTSAAVGVFSDKNVANAKLVTISGLTLEGADALNYTLIQPVTHANITPKELTVAGITAANKVYDGNPTATLNTSSATLTGVVDTEDVTLNLADAAGVFSDKNVGAVKPVTISGLTVIGSDINNYTLTQPGTVADITARPLTVNATGINKIYDGNTTASVTLSDNRVASDELTFTYTATFSDKNAATAKPIIVTDITISGGADKDNYTLANTTAATTADITARPVTVTADTLNKLFGGLDPALTYQVTLGNVISGDNFSGALTRDPGEDPGTYAIRQGNLTLGFNYNLTFIGANLTITGFRMWLPIIRR